MDRFRFHLSYSYFTLYANLLLFFFRRIDIFEKETWSDLLLVFMISCITTFLFTFILPLRDAIFPSIQTENVSFIDMLIGVALLEEIVKIIPVLIILKTMKSINEPIDYLIYASVSALGFAFLENIDYIYMYKEDSFNIVGIRSFLPTAMHIFTTSIIGIGIYNFQKEKKYKFLIISFISAILLHTIYNQFGSIVVPISGIGIPLYFIILLFPSFYYGSEMKKLLKESPFFDINKITDTKDRWNSSDEIKNNYKIPNSKNTIFIFRMLLGVFVIDAIFEYIQSGTYTIDLLRLLVGCGMIFIGFVKGPLNIGDLSKYRQRQLRKIKKETADKKSKHQD